MFDTTIDYDGLDEVELPESVTSILVTMMTLIQHPRPSQQF